MYTVKTGQYKTYYEDDRVIANISLSFQRYTYQLFSLTYMTACNPEQFQMIRQTDRQTDGRTDGIAVR